MRLRLCLLLTLVPLAAGAQTLSLDIDGNDGGTVAVNASQCGTAETVNYVVSSTSYCTQLEVWLTAGSCGDHADAGDLEVGTVPSATLPGTPAGSMQFVVNQLPVDGGCGSAQEQNFTLCGSFQPPGASGITTSCISTTAFIHAATDVIFRYDALPPNAPTILSVTSLDSALSLEVSPSSDTTLVTPRVRPTVDGGTDAGAETGWLVGTAVAVGSRLEIDNLANNVTYEVQVRAQDAADNQSAFSGSEFGTPEALIGFFDRYRTAGGQDTGGCTQAGGTPLWLVAVLPALWAWGRRRWR